MKGGRTYYQLVPVKVLNELPELCELLNDISGFRESYLKQILSVVAFSIQKEGEAAPLKMAYLKKVIPQGDQYIKALLDIGILARCGGYRPGKASYKYRFADSYESEYKTLNVTDAKLIRRVEALESHLKRRNSKKYQEQNKWIRQITIESGWMEVVNRIENDPKKNNKEEKKNYAISAVTRIINGNFYISIDSTSNRLHTNLTNFPKALLPFVRIAGQQLTSLDIKNSQPLISGALLMDPGKFARFTKDPEFSMILKTLQITESKDIKQYVSLVNKGIIYDYLIKEFSRRGVDYTRDQVKIVLLKILFDKNNHSNRNRKIFIELFPEVHRIFSIVRGDLNTSNRFRNYKRFAILLQSAESHLINDCIVKQINQQDPNIITATKYDSVFTGLMTSHAETVTTIMKAEFLKLFGTLPKIEKVKHTLQRDKGGERGNGETYTNTITEPLLPIKLQIDRVGRSMIIPEQILNINSLQNAIKSNRYAI